MKGRLTWICHGATPSNRAGAFPADESLEDKAIPQTGMLAEHLGRVDRIWISPALRARQTAERLSLAGSVEPALRECDYGRWSGKRIADIHSAEPEGLKAWMTDAAAVPHGGESLLQLFERVGEWMDRHLGDEGHAVAVTHASVIRAAVLHVLHAPADAFWSVDVQPLSLMQMSSDGRRWTLRFPNPVRA